MPAQPVSFDFEEGDSGPAAQVVKTAKFSTLVLPKPQAGPSSSAGKQRNVPAPKSAPQKKESAPKPEAASTVAPSSISGPELAKLETDIDDQAKQVVALKEQKADAADIQAAVDKLLALKNHLPEGHPKRPQPKTKGKASAATQASGAQGEDKRKGPAVSEEVEREKVDFLKSVKTDRFGMIEMVQSRDGDKSNKKWTIVGDLQNAALIGQKVLIRGYAHAIKSPSSATFVLVRQRMHTVQCVIEGSDTDMKAYVDKIPVQSVIDVTGEVVKAEVKSATVSQVELKVHSLFVVQPARVRLPFQPREAERPPPPEDQEEEESKKKTKNILQDVRLDHRTLDLRTPAMQAIARVSDAIIRYFAEYLRSQGFVEIMTPKLLAGASEGGAEVFKTDYFGQVACLAQSPQLHKQMCAACSGFERVFEIGPVFRAEKSLTARHMTEFHGLDVEMAINEHYHEALQVFSHLFFYIFDKINETMQSELSVIRLFSPFEDLKYRIPGKEHALVLEFSEGIAMLEEDHNAKNPGCITSEELGLLKRYTKDSDPSTPVEKRLGYLVKQKYGVDFYMLDKYPLAVRPFYTMPDPTNKDHPDQLKSNSYDFFIRGQEVLSGAQRVHDARMLEEHVVAKGIPLESLKFYIDSFKDGALPHAGCGIGLERVVMLFLGIPNIRWAALFSRDPKRLIP